MMWWIEDGMELGQLGDPVSPGSSSSIAQQFPNTTKVSLEKYIQHRNNRMLSESKTGLDMYHVRFRAGSIIEPCYDS